MLQDFVRIKERTFAEKTKNLTALQNDGASIKKSFAPQSICLIDLLQGSHHSGKSSRKSFGCNANKPYRI